MIGTVVYRLITPKIFTRIEVASNAKIIQLKKIIEERTQISPNAQKLYLDKSFTKKITLSDSEPIIKLRLKEGDAIYLQNADAKSEITNNEKAKGTCNHSENEVCINCIDKRKKLKKKKQFKYLMSKYIKKLKNKKVF